MTGARSALQEFMAALQELWEAAGKPPYSALLRLDDHEFGVQTISSQSLSDWFNGKSSPSGEKTKYARALIRRLVTRAPETSPGRRQLMTRQMESLLLKAQTESRQNRGGRPRTALTERRAVARQRSGPAPTERDQVERHRASRERLAVAGRGVRHAGEHGDYFVGRRDALTALASWLRQEHDRKARVVTGAPGTGKSALLGRLLTLADPGTATVRTSADPTTVPPPGSVTVAMDAHHTNLEAVTGDLAEALVGRRETSPEFLLQHLSELADPVTILVDALDEAGPVGDGRDAVRIARELLQPLSAMRSVRLIVGTRRPLVDALGPAVVVLDLDEEQWADHEDIADYAERLLLDRADPYSRSPYRDQPRLARTISRGIAARADRCFLVARMTARYLVEGQITIDPEQFGWQNELPSDVGQAFAAYLRRFGEDEQRVRRVLTPLAYAQGPGLPEPLWAPLAEALSGKPCAHEDIDWVRREHAGAYIYTTSTETGPVFRPFHEALGEYLRGLRSNQAAAHARITDALKRLVPVTATSSLAAIDLQAVPSACPTVLPDLVPSRDWSCADSYTLRYLAAHATVAGQLDDVLRDTDYLVHANPRGLTPHLSHAGTESARMAAAVYRTSLRIHATASRGVRRQVLALDAARVGATSLQNRLVSSIPEGCWTPQWATGSGFSPALRDTLSGHTGPVLAVSCTVLDGTPVAVTGGDDHTVRMWDLTSGAPIGRPLTGHTGRVWAVTCTVLDGTPVAVTGGDDHTVRVWDLASGAPIGRPLTGHTGRVRAVACTMVDGAHVAVTGSDGDTVRVWDLASGAPFGRPLPRCTKSVGAVACMLLDGTPIAVTGDDFGRVYAWDLTSSNLVGRHLDSDRDGVSAVACTVLDGAPTVVTASRLDGTVRAWNLASDAPVGRLLAHHGSGVSAAACTVLDGTPVAVTGGGDHTVRLWDLVSGAPIGQPLTGHSGGVFDLALTELDGTPIAVTGGIDKSVRVWDLGPGAPVGRPSTGHSKSVWAVECAKLSGVPVAVTGGGDTMRVWDLASGAPVGEHLTGRDRDASALACAVLDGTPIAVTGGADPAKVWDLASSPLVGRPLNSDENIVSAVACADLEGTPLAVTVSHPADRDDDLHTVDTVRIWDLATGAPVGEPLTGNHSRVSAIACTQVDGTPLAVTAHYDRTLWVWDLASRPPVGRPLTECDSGMSAVACTELEGIPIAVTGHHDGTVRVWDLASGAAVGQPLTGHGSVQAVACTVLDGKSVAATAGFDDTVRVWNLRTGEPTGLLPVPSPHAVAFTGAGDLVVAMGKDVAVFRRSLQAGHPH
ncbi:AAA family ATPase [Streptomyces coerulescens]|uniref:AAA family ATPase n=1 Tax=Streptomyces coerulescens TaxID=29304 RepID=A0ABW0CY80_STRCD